MECHKKSITIKDDIVIVNHRLIRGDSRQFAFRVPIEFAASITAVKLTARQKDATEDAFSCDLTDGITEVEAGKYQVRIAPEKTTNLSGRYQYDIQVNYNESDVKTIIGGVFEIVEDVTR